MNPPLASWWPRVRAAVMDAVPAVLGLGVVGLFFYDSLLDGLRLWRNAGSTNLFSSQFGLLRPTLTVAAITVACVLLVTSILVTWKGGTLGMLTVGLRVVPTGRPWAGRVPFRTAFVRTLAYVIACLIPVLALIGLVLVIVMPRRQAVHDLVARTQVITVW